ncbi:C4-type zinc ribbon domain-containing protein [Phycisphaeraceae bacterium D3-23]
MSLQDQLRAFYELDQRVRAMRSRLDAAINRQAAQERKKSQLDQQAAELQAQHKQHQAKAALLESEASGLEARITGLRDKMNAVTSNKEYSALLVEVNTGKLEQSKQEELALAAMTKVEELAGELEALQARVQEQDRIAKAAATDVEEARSEVGEQLDALSRERDEAGEPLSPAVRKQFDRLCVVHDGEAMAGIEEQNKRRMEYTCDGCFTLIPVETVNTLITRPDEVITCSNCERILFVSDEIRSSLSGAKS